MNNNLPIDNLLLEIGAEEGDGFTCDRDKIVADLSAQRAAFSNWGISLLSVIGGVLAALFFIGFILLAGMYDSPNGLLIVGFIFIAGSVWLNTVVKNLLLDTATISFYIAGYAMMIAGLFEMHTDDNWVIPICLVLSLGVIFISDSAMLVFISVLICNGSLLSLIMANDAFNAIHLFVAYATLAYTYLSLHQAALIAMGAGFNNRYNPVRTGFLLSLLISMTLITQHTWFDIYINWIWFSSIILIMAVLFTVYKITQSLRIVDSRQLIPIYILSALILLPALFAPAIAGSLLILVLGFHNGHKLGFISGIVALIYFVSRYYYDLHFNLLTKSVILMVSGLLLILLFFGLKKQLQTNDYV